MENECPVEKNSEETVNYLKLSPVPEVIRTLYLAKQMHTR
jgi:hypothetical protein